MPLIPCILEKNNKPTYTWGTCAGLILLANKLKDTKIGGQTKVEFVMLSHL